MYWLYSTSLCLGLLASLPYWVWKSLRQGKYRLGLAERLGALPPRLLRNPTTPVIWVHAVSVGELLAVSGLVEGIKLRFPKHRVIVSTTTDTGQQLARKRFGKENVCYFPLDLGFAIRPYLRTLQPELVVITETEFWPNFLRLAHRSGAKIAVVNGRISDRSWPGYRRWRKLLGRFLQPVDIFLAQTNEDRQRLVAIGASENRVLVIGNLKFDQSSPSPPPVVASLRDGFQRGGAGPILICGSTVEGEEAILVNAFERVLADHPRAIMILAPRHPERFREAGELLQSLPLRFWRRSTWNGEPLSGGVFLLDSIGELASVYALGDIAFVGGSLVPRGGHNIVEPAQFGVPVLIGPHTENFRDVVKSFKIANAVRVVLPVELPFAFLELASSAEERKALGGRAAEVVRAQKGATQRTLEALDRLLPNQSATLTPASTGREDGLPRHHEYRRP
jgi:3-deoxy-D-manno-octulosonic-acid transferase